MKEESKMAFQTKSFVLSSKDVPVWLNDEAAKGRVKFVFDDNDELVGATVYTPTKTLNAKVGDTIMLMKSGLAVLPAGKAKKYGVTKEEK